VKNDRRQITRVQPKVDVGRSRGFVIAIQSYIALCLMQNHIARETAAMIRAEKHLNFALGTGVLASTELLN